MNNRWAIPEYQSGPLNGIELNFQLQREEAEKALKTFHSKLEFVEKYAFERGVADLPGNQMVWFHNLRNELHHSGNGMIPEFHVLEGARAASITVFKALFGVDLNNRLGLESSKIAEAAQVIPATSADPRMDLSRLVQNAR